MHKIAALISRSDWHQTKCRLALCSPKHSGMYACVSVLDVHECTCVHTCTCVYACAHLWVWFVQRKKKIWKVQLQTNAFGILQTVSCKEQFWWQAHATHAKGMWQWSLLGGLLLCRPAYISQVCWPRLHRPLVTSLRVSDMVSHQPFNNNKNQNWSMGQGSVNWPHQVRWLHRDKSTWRKNKKVLLPSNFVFLIFFFFFGGGSGFSSFVNFPTIHGYRQALWLLLPAAPRESWEFRVGKKCSLKILESHGTFDHLKIKGS